MASTPVYAAVSARPFRTSVSDTSSAAGITDLVSSTTFDSTLSSVSSASTTRAN